MWFFFPLNCGHHSTSDRLIEIIILFDMTRRLPECCLDLFVGAYMVPRLSDKCLEVSI